MTINDRYFKWLISFVKSKQYPLTLYSELLAILLAIDFQYYYPMDENRAVDGLSLRYRFMDENRNNYICPDDMNIPCSVLEMMIALAIRCEEDIMYDDNIGNRTADWFWSMVESLGLTKCTNDNLNEHYILRTIERFLVRDYEINGSGGLFTVNNGTNVRDKEIWYQMCDYLNYIIERRSL